MWLYEWRYAPYSMSPASKFGGRVHFDSRYMFLMTEEQNSTCLLNSAITISMKSTSFLEIVLHFNWNETRRETNEQKEQKDSAKLKFRACQNSHSREQLWCNVLNTVIFRDLDDEKSLFDQWITENSIGNKCFWVFKWFFTWNVKIHFKKF